MKFKRSFNVYVDNFSSTYKLLLYKIVVSILFACVGYAVVYQIIDSIADSEALSDLFAAVGDFFSKLVNGQANELGEVTDRIIECWDEIVDLIRNQQSRIIWCAVILVVVYLVSNFLQGLGHYTVGCTIHDKMSMHAKTPFRSAMVKNLGKACAYNAIYVPLSFLYDAVCAVLIWALFIKAFSFIPLLIRIFLIILAAFVLIVVKMTFTNDWVAAMTSGGMGPGQAMRYSFRRKGKHTASVFSNYVVIILIILAANIAAAILTLCIGLLITIPGSYMLILAFQHVNYFDDNEMSYFLDKNTVVKPDKEKEITREEFFRGDE